MGQANRSSRELVRLRQGGCTVRSVRGFLRGNNANNSNLSPLTMNANNAPSVTDSEEEEMIRKQFNIPM